MCIYGKIQLAQDAQVIDKIKILWFCVFMCSEWTDFTSKSVTGPDANMNSCSSLTKHSLLESWIIPISF